MNANEFTLFVLLIVLLSLFLTHSATLAIVELIVGFIYWNIIVRQGGI